MSEELIVVRSIEETVEAVKNAVIAQFNRRVEKLGPPPRENGSRVEAELTWFHEAMSIYDSMQVHIVGDGVGGDAVVRTSILAGLYASKPYIMGRCQELWARKMPEVSSNGRMTKDEIDSLYNSENGSHNEGGEDMPIPKGKQELFGKVIGKNLNEGKSKAEAKETAEKAVGAKPSVMMRKGKGKKKD